MKKINKIIIVLCIISILILSFNAFYKTDDYGFMLNISELGIIRNCIGGYFSWDGRFLSLGAFVQCFILHFFSIKFVFLFWTLCFLFSGFLIQNILKSESNGSNFGLNSFTGLLFAILLWFASMPILNEVVFWAVGGVYAFDLLIGAIWVVLFLNFQKSNINNYRYLFFVFTVITGGLTQNLTIPLIVLVLITLSTSKHKENKQLFYFNVLVVLFLFLGLSIIQFAPGNLVRIKALNVKSFDFAIFELIKNMFILIFVHSKRLYFFIILLIFVGLVFLKDFFSVGVDFLKVKRIRNWQFKEVLFTFLSFFKWAIIGVSSILPFIFIPSMTSFRTSIFFVFFMILFFIDIIIRVFKRLIIEKINFKYNFILLLFGLSFFLLNASYFKRGLVLKNEIDKRVVFLENSKGKKVKVKLIDPKLSNNIYYFSDYGYPETPENIWIKKNQEMYFNVKINVVR
ncbi:MAG: DUF6056 family protein [Limnohabitans sp.]|nr:DUF6056 family protein [Limnohabitans sp.]